MDALKRSVERAGSNMDSVIHLDVFLCLPLAETIPTPAGEIVGSALVVGPPTPSADK